MATYHVTYSCGHDGDVSLSGPHDERQRKLDWYSEQAVCPDCYRAQRSAAQSAAGPQMYLRVVPAYDGQAAYLYYQQQAEIARLRLQLAREYHAAAGEPMHCDAAGRPLVADQSAQRSIRAAMADLERESARTDAQAHRPAQRSRPGYVEIVAGAGSYDIRETLKARGYRFGAVAISGGPVAVMSLTHEQRGWTLTITGDTPETVAERAAAEVAWIKAQGYHIEAEDMAGRLMASVMSGRAELVGMAGHPASDEAHAAALAQIREQHQQRLAELQAARTAADARQRENARLSTFRVAARPGSVRRNGSDIEIDSTDGRVARGNVWDGEAYIKDVAGKPVDPNWPEAERIGRDALAQVQGGV